MGAERRAGRRRDRPRLPAGPTRERPAEAFPALPVHHPAALLVHVLAALCVLLSVSQHLYETDMWQHLAAGRAIWGLHRVPTTQIWTWPTYGAPDVNYAWGFEVLLWPFWKLGGVAGLFAWRWLTTLAAFTLAWLVARRMGARGLAVPVVMALAALAYRDRAHIRPESLVGILIPLELLILEARRRGGPDRSAWIVPIQWAWANTHISWGFGFLFLGLYEGEALLSRRRASQPPGRWWRHSLVPVAAASLAISFLNPFGWRTLAAPFHYLLVQRGSPLYQLIEELRPLSAADLARTWAPLLLAGWPLLAIARARRFGIDRVEAALCVVFTAFAIAGSRFLGPWALVAGPFVARALDERLRSPGRPAWSRGSAVRAAAAAAALGLIAGLGMVRPALAGRQPGFGADVEWRLLPVQVCDFMEARGLRGRGFNSFEIGGYLLHRFWPDSTRLPFIDIHQAGSERDLAAYAAMYADPSAWRELDARHRFDWALVQDPLQADALDADSLFVPVYREDCAVLYARRDGALAALAERFGYRLLPGGSRALERLGAATERDAGLARRVEEDVVRAVRESRFHGTALSLLANLEAGDGRWTEAHRHLDAAVRIQPVLPFVEERLGRYCLALGRPTEAVRHFEREWRGPGRSARVAALLGDAWRARGEVGRARAWYERALRLDPGFTPAAESLETSRRSRGPYSSPSTER